MKTIVLFHRLELTNLYVDIGRHLGDRMKIIHLAYSDHEVDLLRRSGVEGPIVHFKDEVRALWRELPVPDPGLLQQIDDTIIEQTQGAFTLNGAIQSDRGFVSLDNEECLRLAAAYYRFWDRFVAENGVDYVIHETPSLLFNVIAAIILAKYGGQYLYNIMVPSEAGSLQYLSMHGFDFSCDDIDRAIGQVGSGEIAVDADRCARFIAEYRKDLSVFLGSSISRNANLPRLFAGSVRNRLHLALNRRKFDRHVDNVDYWDLRRNVAGQKLSNLIAYRSGIDFDDFDPSVPYYFYGFQLEPEAGVYYQGHGLYMNQVKLIQNIAAQLPAGTVLYVKDHPHDHGYREAVDYRRLTQVPNIRLLPSHIPARQLIQKAQGVMTITGTAGFEAILMGKTVFAFGKTFYSACPLVVPIRNIRDLREQVYMRRGRQYDDAREIFPFVMAFLAASRPGLIDYYGGRSTKYGVDLDENARKIADMLVEKALGTP
ncbi:MULTISPECIES: capsular polysaccharide export protein, LipB/KpsS family [unclassified Sphingomonas]|uniref:capsular polysaccharide export protein, LipB/KpsS family n=1 Tax=unclassified Sphingomonas TaxID=196159 RepID=UPI0006F8E26B|nr:MULTISPECIES: hypothetical protein [unclassified Sphingomonas]KQX19532.1 hypothetical protein ASD17_13540 [Sphingomonas sp. Root1294]KQY65733.1 hypothetical protein ASD39_16740 [Sphingomonas sp. Root50]KRB94962.1 hypothetical protein ASE22_03315 [Sphingomonas sp. Root720]